MNRPITANKRKDTPHNANTKAQSLGLPMSHVYERGKGLSRIALWPKNQQGNQDGEETKDMQDQERSFELG